MLDLYDKTRDVVWVDSVTLHWCLKKMGVVSIYKPGTSILHGHRIRDLTNDNWYFLTAHASSVLPRKMYTELPFMEKVVISSELKSVIDKLPTGTKVGIGVSAPKQNLLATMLYALRPDLEYHCLGAAISNDQLCRQSNKTYFLQPASGVEWVRFLKKSPTRTIKKITATLKQLALIKFVPTLREKFLLFSRIVECNDDL